MTAKARRGIVLAGGAGSRLYPATLGLSKQLLPVYDKPMVYYPLSVLMLAGIRDILLIATPEDVPLFRRLLGDGSAFGIALEYAVQPRPEGIAQALVIARDFLAGAPSALVLGDNLFHGPQFSEKLRRASARTTGATVFAAAVRDPERFGVLAYDRDGAPSAILEKPAQPPSPHAVTGLYFYDAEAPALAARLQPSARGELEITDLNNRYLARGALEVELLGRGFAWLDTGTPDSLMEAAQYVQTVERQQGLKIACLEEIAWRQGWLAPAALAGRAAQLGATAYAQYLRQLAEQT
ncbi:MAG: glucose-1-phosphate thymidylyltransferase RfbA [Moraxellaceae bacterium]